MFKQSWEEWYALFLFHCDMYEGVQPEIAFHRFEKFYENENLLIAMYHIKSGLTISPHPMTDGY